MKLKYNLFMEFPKATNTATPFHERSEANCSFSRNSPYLIMMTSFLLQSTKNICLSHFRNYVETAIKPMELHMHSLVLPIFQNFSHFNVACMVLFMIKFPRFLINCGIIYLNLEIITLQKISFRSCSLS